MRHPLPAAPVWWEPGPARAVFRVQCFTWSRAQAMTGRVISCLPVDMSAPMPQDALFSFRALPGHRSAAALILRHTLARDIKQERKQ